MAHPVRDKTELLNRVRRLKGRIEAGAKAIGQGQIGSSILLAEKEKSS